VVKLPGFPPFKIALSAGSTPYSWGNEDEIVKLAQENLSHDHC